MKASFRLKFFRKSRNHYLRGIIFWSHAGVCGKGGSATADMVKSQKNYSIVTTAHPFTGIHITEKGLDYLENYVKEVREVISYDVPLAIDHFGHVCVEDCIRFARRMEPYNLAWIEDMVPWMYTDQYVRLKNSTTILVCTGDDTEGKAEAKNGECSFRGFYGTYNITVNYGGKTKTVTADFSKLSDNNMAFDI